MSKELFFLGRISPKSFIRDRKMPFPDMIAFIINLAKKSLQLELNSFTDLRKNLSDITKQAFSKARQNLSPAVFKLLNEELLIEFYSDNEINLFKGFRVFGIDGSMIRLPESEEMHKEYGSDVVNNSVPLARTSVLHDVLNHMTIDATLEPRRSSERHMAIENILALCRFDALVKGNHVGDIIIFDRGYPWLFLMIFILLKNKDFVMRCSSNVFLEAHAAVQGDCYDATITMPIFKPSRTVQPQFAEHLSDLAKDAVITVRVLRFTLSSGEEEILITSLIDQSQFTYDDFFKLYGLRWNSEEAYKLYKNIAEIENFSGKSKVTVEQDFYATIFTCNMSSILMQEAQAEVEQEQLKKIESSPKNKCKYTYKINRNVLIGSMKNEIIQALLSDCDLDTYCEQFKKRIKKSLVAVRPNRSFPRNFRKREKSVNRRAL